MPAIFRRAKDLPGLPRLIILGLLSTPYRDTSVVPWKQAFRVCQYDNLRILSDQIMAASRRCIATGAFISVLPSTNHNLAGWVSLRSSAAGVLRDCWQCQVAISVPVVPSRSEQAVLQFRLAHQQLALRILRDGTPAVRMSHLNLAVRQDSTRGNFRSGSLESGQ